MAATCMAVCKGSRKKIRGIFISSCHLPAAVECDIVILSKPGPNPTGSSWAVLRTQLIPARGRVGDCGHRPLLRRSHKNMMFCIAVRLPFERTQSETRSRPQEMPSHFRNLVMPTTGGHMGPPGRNTMRFPPCSANSQYPSQLTVWFFRGAFLPVCRGALFCEKDRPMGKFSIDRLWNTPV